MIEGQRCTRISCSVILLCLTVLCNTVRRLILVGWGWRIGCAPCVSLWNSITGLGFLALSLDDSHSPDGRAVLDFDMASHHPAAFFVLQLEMHLHSHILAAFP
jgi:hypothetical protein